MPAVEHFYFSFTGKEKFRSLPRSLPCLPGGEGCNHPDPSRPPARGSRKERAGSSRGLGLGIHSQTSIGGRVQPPQNDPFPPVPPLGQRGRGWARGDGTEPTAGPGRARGRQERNESGTQRGSGPGTKRQNRGGSSAEPLHEPSGAARTRVGSEGFVTGGWWFVLFFFFPVFTESK